MAPSQPQPCSAPQLTTACESSNSCRALRSSCARDERHSNEGRDVTPSREGGQVNRRGRGGAAPPQLQTTGGPQVGREAARLPGRDWRPAPSADSSTAPSRLLLQTPKRSLPPALPHLRLHSLPPANPLASGTQQALLGKRKRWTNDTTLIRFLHDSRDTLNACQETSLPAQRIFLHDPFNESSLDPHQLA